MTPSGEVMMKYLKILGLFCWFGSKAIKKLMCIHSDRVVVNSILASTTSDYKA